MFQFRLLFCVKFDFWKDFAPEGYYNEILTGFLHVLIHYTSLPSHNRQKYIHHNPASVIYCLMH
jgi:hypothetical protein